MQKIRKFNRNVHEIGVRVKLRYIYGTNTRNRAGPLPRPHGLNMHIQRPPRGQAWPPSQEFRLWSGVGLLLMSHFLSFVWCLICLISGSALRALSEIAVYTPELNQHIFGTMLLFTKARSCFRSLERACCGGKPHKTCPIWYQSKNSS